MIRDPLTAEGPFDLWLLTTTDPSVNPPESSSSTKSWLMPHFCRTELYARVKVSSIWGNTANLGSSLWSVEQKPEFLMSRYRSNDLFQSLRVCMWGLLLRKKKQAVLVRHGHVLSMNVAPRYSQLVSVSSKPSAALLPLLIVRHFNTQHIVLLIPNFTPFLSLLPRSLCACMVRLPSQPRRQEQTC